MPKQPKTADLTPKQQRFVAEYLVDLNGKQAGIRAGYSPKTAEAQASYLLSIPKVQAAVQAAMQAREKRTGITQDRVLAELELLAFSDLTHYTVSDLGDVALTADAPAGAMRAVQSIKRRITASGSGEDQRITREVELKLWDKPGPLKIAGKHVGLFADKVEVTGPNGGPIEISRKALTGLTDAELATVEKVAGLASEA